MAPSTIDAGDGKLVNQRAVAKSQSTSSVVTFAMVFMTVGLMLLFVSVSAVLRCVSLPPTISTSFQRDNALHNLLVTLYEKLLHIARVIK